jgi:hypothetical protein
MHSWNEFYDFLAQKYNFISWNAGCFNRRHHQEVGGLEVRVVGGFSPLR